MRSMVRYGACRREHSAWPAWVGLIGCLLPLVTSACSTNGQSTLDDAGSTPPTTPASPGGTAGAGSSAGPPPSESYDAGLGSPPPEGGAASDAGGDGGGRLDGGGHDDGSGDAGSTTDAGAFCPVGEPCRIMPFGDSITFGLDSTTGGGYRVELETRIMSDSKNATMVGTQSSGPDTLNGVPFDKQNEGYPGYRIDELDYGSDMGFSLMQTIQTDQPHIILLHIGTNDIINQVDLSTAPARLQTLVDHVTELAPDALVVVAQIIPCFSHPMADDQVQAYNVGVVNVVQAEAAAGKHVVTVDMHSVISMSDYGDDVGVHPNDVGYAAMGDTWYAAISNYLVE